MKALIKNIYIYANPKATPDIAPFYLQQSKGACTF